MMFGFASPKGSAQPATRPSQLLGLYQALSQPLDGAAEALESWAGRIGVPVGRIDSALGGLVVG